MGAAARLSFLHTSLVAGDHDLSERVERLLHVEAPQPEPGTLSRFRVPVAALFAAMFLAALAFWPPTLSSVHHLLEQFLR
jgi:hypothetical protein